MIVKNDINQGVRDHTWTKGGGGASEIKSNGQLSTGGGGGVGNHPGDPEESRDEVGTARVHAHALDNPERPPSAQVTAKQNSPICDEHHTQPTKV